MDGYLPRYIKPQVESYDEGLAGPVWPFSLIVRANKALARTGGMKLISSYVTPQ